MKDKNKLKKQLISGAVYACLAAVMVAVTTSTIVSMLSQSNNFDIPDTTKYNTNDFVLPDIKDFSDISKNNESNDVTVSDIKEGVSSEITESEVSDVQSTDQTVTEQVEDYGYPGYVKPCDGYISREFSLDELTYSATMSDFRTHRGIDIVCEKGTPVVAVTGGKVTDIKNDTMYGITVTTQSPDGLILKYSNLSSVLYSGIELGAIVKTGENIGGVGDTAICEAAEPSHLHLEAIKGENYIDPEQFFSESYAKETALSTQTQITD